MNFYMGMSYGIKPNPQPAASTINDSQRFSLDIVDDLKVVLEEKKMQSKKDVIFQQQSSPLPPSPPKKEQHRHHHLEKEYRSSSKPKDFSTLSCNDSIFGDSAATIEAESSEWPRPSDESFETMERMCDKTASDPDSTLFQYLNSDCRDQVFAEAKQRSVDGNLNLKILPRAYDAEADALQRLLDELRVEEEAQLENESPIKGVEVTQLEDIEAPSRIWDVTTMSSGGGGDKTLLQTSPVKMVGLLRPSTIIEDVNESSSLSDASSTQMSASFQSASFKGGATTSEVSSSCYETAEDSTTVSSVYASRQEQQQQQLLPDIVDFLYAGEGGDSRTNTNETHEAPFSENLIELNQSIGLNQSIDLIDLEKTFADLQNSSQTSLLEETLSKFIGSKMAPLTPQQQQQLSNESPEDSDTDDSIIEVLSDDGEENLSAFASSAAITSQKPVAELAVIKSEQIIQQQKILPTATDGRRSGFPAAFANNEAKAEFDDNKENCVNVSAIASLDSSQEKSLHFNDTMEEVDYILAKGMQQMAAAKSLATKVSAASTAELSPSPLKVKQNTFLLSPKVADRYRSPSPMLHKQRPIAVGGAATVGRAHAHAASPRSAASTTKPAAAASSTSLKKPKAINRFALDMKPIPKLDIFKKPPQVTSGIPTSSTRHKQFANIYSPVGAYMKKTGSSPLIANFKSSNKSNSDLLNATAYRELEYESRLYQPKFESGSTSGGPASAANLLSRHLPATGSSLPKKAYISSEFKQIVDERTPVTIPGGKSIQKYLESAMLPAVVRHDGKMKIPGGVKGVTAASMKGDAATDSATKNAAAKRNNPSLADLSLMSGDVSMYTIMDAQKF